MTASKKNISHNSLCAFKASPAGFATAQSQLWPDLYSCPDWNPRERKSSAILHRILAVPSAISRPFYLKYICLCVHLLVVSSITRFCTKPKSSGSCFSCPEIQSKSGWCRRAASKMRKLLCYVISKPLWLLLKPSFPWSFLCGLFIWSLKRQFCFGYFGDVDGCLHVPTTIFPSAVRILGSWRDSRAKGMPWFVPFHHCSKSC